MNASLYVAAVLILAIGIAHSWLGLAGVLVLAANPPVTARGLGAVVGGTFLAHSALALFGSRGRHYSWVVFLAIGMIAILATRG